MTFKLKTDGGPKVWFCRLGDTHPPELRWRMLDEGTVKDMTVDDFRALHLDIEQTLHALSRETFAFAMANHYMTTVLHEMFTHVLEGRDG